MEHKATNFKLHYVDLGESDLKVLASEEAAELLGLTLSDTFDVISTDLLSIVLDMDGYEEICELGKFDSFEPMIESSLNTMTSNSLVHCSALLSGSYYKCCNTGAPTTKGSRTVFITRTILPGDSIPICIVRISLSDYGKQYTYPGRNIVYYHDHCMDGLGAKFSAWLHFKDSAEYRPFTYGKTVVDDVDNATVYFLDSSVKLDILQDLCTKASSVHIIDHHKTARDDLVGQDLPMNAHLVFDMERSGAVMAWDYFFSGIPVPRVLELIQDRDLWRHDFEESTLLYYAKQSRSDVDERFILHCAEDFDYLDQIIGSGVPIKDYVDVQLNSMQEDFFLVDIGEHKDVPTINCAHNLISDVLDLYLKQNPNVPFAAAYIDTSDTRKWSLRSTKETGFDVGALAREFGGGGHAQASGFVTKIGKRL